MLLQQDDLTPEWLKEEVKTGVCKFYFRNKSNNHN